MRCFPISTRFAFSPLLLLLSSCVAATNDDGPAPNVSVGMNIQSQPADQYTLPPLDQLLAPVALYPDPLLSLVLPASTYPDQVQQASNFLQQGGSPSQIGYMSWDSSVQGLAHYPEVIVWMAANPDWTMQLGGAFANQPGDVMDAVQDLRRRAQAAGTLVSTPQQRVFVYNDEVQIEPEQPQMIYVPQYDPAVVYVAQPPGFYAGPLFAWSQPYPTGIWMTFDFDWRNHGVYHGDWYDYRMQHGGWSHPVDYSHFRNDGGMNRGYSDWRAPRNAPAPPPQLSGSRSGVSAGAHEGFAQPAVIRGTPRPPANAAHVNSLVVTRNEHPVSAYPGTAARNQPQTGARGANEAGQAHAPVTGPGPANIHAGTTPDEHRPLTPAERSMEPGAGRGSSQSPPPATRTVIEPRAPVQTERSYEPGSGRNPGPVPPSPPSHPAAETKAPVPAEHSYEPPAGHNGGEKPPSSATRPEPAHESAPARAPSEAAKPKAMPAPREQPQKPKDKDKDKDQDNPPK